MGGNSGARSLKNGGSGESFLKSNLFFLLIILMGLIVFFSISGDYFATADNFYNIMGQMVELGLLTLAMSAAMFSGGFDLSIGAVGSFGTIMLGVFITQLGMNIYVAMLIVFVMIVGIGFFNGFLIGYLKIEPMLATLGMQGMIAGLTLGIAQGDVIQILNPEYFFGKLRVGGVIPFQFIIFLIAIAVTVVLFNYTRWGRRVYMIGANREVATYSGINVPKTTMMVYVFSSIMAFLAAVIISSRLESGKSNLLDTQVLQTVTAAVFGGISIQGGKGNVWGAVIGVVTFSVISNGLNMMGVDQNVKQIVTGGVLLAVLALNIWRERRVLEAGK